MQKSFDQLPEVTVRTTEPSRSSRWARRLLSMAAVLSVLVGVVFVGSERVPNPLADSNGAVAETVDPSTTEGGVGNGGVDPAQPQTPVNDRQSRFVPRELERLIDTRQEEPPPAPARFVASVPEDQSAMVVSVSVMGSSQAGSVTVDGGAGRVVALSVAKPGITTSNLVFVPVLSSQISVTSSAGGHIIVDLIGSFESVDRSREGRFTPVDSRRVVEHNTESAGRELFVDYGPAVPLDQTSRVLVVITADVGRRGGQVVLGPDDSSGQVLMWGPALADDRQRRGLAIVDPNGEESSRIRYEGGTDLVVDVIGYFTNESVVSGDRGLYVPTGPREVFDGPLGPDKTVTVDGFGSQTSAVLVTVGPTDGAIGRFGTQLVVPAAGEVTLAATSQGGATATILGEFR